MIRIAGNEFTRTVEETSHVGANKPHHAQVFESPSQGEREDEIDSLTHSRRIDVLNAKMVATHVRARGNERGTRCCEGDYGG